MPDRDTVSPIRLSHCPECNYDLTGLTPPVRCPECGTAYTADVFCIDGFHSRFPLVQRISRRWGLPMLSVAVIGILIIVITGSGKATVLGCFFGILLHRLIARLRRRGPDWCDAMIIFSNDGVAVFDEHGLTSTRRWSLIENIDLKWLSESWWRLSIRILTADVQPRPDSPSWSPSALMLRVFFQSNHSQIDEIRAAIDDRRAATHSIVREGLVHG